LGSYARRLTRFRIGPDGSLGGRELFAEFGHGTYPDGLAFDVECALWATSVVSNRLIRVARDGSRSRVLDDGDPGHVAWVEEAYLAGRLGRPHMDKIAARVLKSLSSIAFGGDDLRTAHLGVLLGDRLPLVRLPVAGIPMVHWDWR